MTNKKKIKAAAKKAAARGGKAAAPASKSSIEIMDATVKRFARALDRLAKR